MNISYVGPVRDFSGYGEASRHHIGAFYASKINLEIELVSYTIDTADFGSMGLLTTQLLENKVPYHIRVLHITPDQYKNHIKEGKYHIGAFYWETDTIPKEFAEGLELVDEIWTGSEANKQAIIKGGVEKPIYIFPQSTEVERQWPDKYKVPDIKDNAFVFYSIFEWTDRKNPRALLEAYYKEFQKGENVALLIKTYFGNFTMNNKKKIRYQINAVKNKLGLKKFPPVYLYMDLMDRNQIMRFHKTGDCYVSPHRGEGWGIPQVEAMLAGKPVITTGYGGVNEYLTDKKDALVLPYKMKPLFGMEHSSRWYNSKQNWADIEVKDLQKAMRSIYLNDKLRDKIAKEGNKLVKDAFNFETVGGMMKKRLEEIDEAKS